MFRITFYILLFVFSISSCSAQLPITDKSATPETAILYGNLQKFANQGIMFGHQDDLAYGVNWKYEPGRSDVKDATGDYPAVYGWELGGLERDSDKNIDGVPFDKMRQFIKDAKNRGGVVTISWHMDHPVTSKNAWDTTHGAVSAILPGGNQHEKFKRWLDKGARFLNSLKDDSGKTIPVLFRPYHELTGNWFWWCKNSTSPAQFKELWKFTIGYLQSKGVHNLIYVYNTSDFKNREEFLEYYPGSAYVDVLSFDKYQYNDPKTDNAFVESTLKMFGIMDAVAKEQNKIMAFAETGYEAIPYDKWWTDTLLKSMGDYKISYVLVWRNHGWNTWMNPPRMHYYAPFEGQASQKDFIKFHDLDRIFFEKDAAKAKLYAKRQN